MAAFNDKILELFQGRTVFAWKLVPERSKLKVKY